MPNQSKFEAVAEIKVRFDDASTVILADYRGLSVKEMQQFRTKLRDAGGDVKVYKNSLTEIALRELEMPDMGAMLEGPTAFVFATGDPSAPAKAMADFAKAHPALELKGGFIDGALADAATVAAIAALPSREELLSKLMGMLNNPVRGFMAMCNAPAAAFVRTVQAVADQRAAAA
jgi:large subunit ribosomal protein L10